MSVQTRQNFAALESAASLRAGSRDGGTLIDVARDESRLVRLFGLDITDTVRERAAQWIVDRAAAGASTQIAFINAHCVNVMAQDEAYRRALKRADRLYADGSGVMMAAAAFGVKLRDNLNGTDLFPLVCSEAARRGVKLFLFGSRAGIASAAGHRMALQYPGLELSSHHGYLKSSSEEDELIGRINDSGARIVLVGLGVPTQELWIARNRSRLLSPVVMGVGGLFDYYSGRIPRAPLGLRKVGLEWVWRTAMEPRRLGRRYLVGNVEFLVRLAWSSIRTPELFQQPAPGSSSG